MPNVIGLSFVLAAFVFQCILGEECTTRRPTDTVKQFECGQCKKSENLAETCYEAFPCRWCCQCPPGTYVAEHCTSSNVREPTDTRCEFCEPGFYTSTNNNASSCKESKSEDFCKPLPYTKFVRGSIKEDNKCVCIDGTYSSSPEIAGCKNHHQCPIAFGVKLPGNGTHDVECEPCPEGMCSDEVSSNQRCQMCDKLIKSETAITSIFTSSTPPTTIETLASETPSAEPSTSNEPIGLYVVIGLLVLVIVGLCIAYIVRKKIKRDCCPKDPEIPVHYDANGNESHAQEGGLVASGTSNRNNTARTGTQPTPLQPEEEPLLDPRDSKQEPEQIAGHEKEEEHSPEEPERTAGRDKEEVVAEKQQETNVRSSPARSPSAKKEKGTEKEHSGEDDMDMEPPQQEPSSSSLPSENGKCGTFVSLKQERNGQSSPAEGPVKGPPPEDIVEGLKSELHEQPALDDEAIPYADEPLDPKSRKAKLTENQYTKIFLENGYEVSFNPDLDGNCQFSAIMFLLYPELLREEINEKARELRRKVVDYMENHPQQFVDFIDGDWNTYLAKMLKISEYGDNLTLQAASKVLQRTFKIIQTSNPEKPLPNPIAPTSLPQPQPAQKELVLGHVDENHGMHYVCLKPKTSDRTSPVAQTPMCDSRVDQDSQFRFDKISAPSRLSSSASQNGLFSPLRNLPAPDSRQEQASPSQQQPSPTALPSPSENGPDVQQQNNVSNGIGEHLELFVHEQDRAALSQVPGDVLQSALDSKDYLREMLLGRHGLYRVTSTQDVKDFIRQYRLSERDVDVDDIVNENADDHREMRRKLLENAQHNQGRSKLTPRKILKLTVEHTPRKIYDDLCNAFIKYMQQNANAGES